MFNLSSNLVSSRRVALSRIGSRLIRSFLLSGFAHIFLSFLSVVFLGKPSIAFSQSSFNCKISLASKCKGTYLYFSFFSNLGWGESVSFASFNLLPHGSGNILKIKRLPRFLSPYWSS